MAHITPPTVYTCDGCGKKEAVDKSYTSPEGWYELWRENGNAEIEEEYDFCSRGCLADFASK